MNTFFSIILPVHRHEQQLAPTLKSLEDQTLDPSTFEVILCPSAGSSLLETDEFIKNFKINIRTITPSNEKNYSDNYSLKNNLGAEQSQGNWVYFISEDYILDKECLSEALKVATQWNSEILIGKTIDLSHSPDLTPFGNPVL